MLFALAAEEAKLEVVAHLGAWNPHASHPAIRQREQWIAGSIYRWMPSVDFVHLNPGIFTVMYFLGLPFVAQFGMLALPFGDGLNAPPSNEDIARVAVGSLMNPERHIGKCYRPTGPKLIQETMLRKWSLNQTNYREIARFWRAIFQMVRSRSHGLWLPP